MFRDPSKHLSFNALIGLQQMNIKTENPKPKSKFKYITKYKHVIKLGIHYGHSVCVHINDFNHVIKVNDDAMNCQKLKL